MIKGTKLTDKEYFQVELDSQSSLKMFSDDRKKYFKKFLLGEKLQLDNDEAQALKMGDLVDCLILNEEEFDKKFYLTTCTKIPTGKMLNFCKSLLKLTREYTNDLGEVTVDFKKIALEAYEETEWSHSFETVLKNFNTEAESYYREKRLSEGKTVITSSDLENAKRIVEELKSNDFTYEIFRKGENKITQLVIDNFNILGLDLKAKLDLVIIDEENKTVQPYDLKVVWSVENFVKDYYLYRKAYIQAYIYTEALKFKFQDYKVLPIKFIVSDSINYYKPLIYSLNEEDLRKAYEGFTVGYINYPGVKTIIEDLLWAKERNVWSISKNNYEKKGYIELNLVLKYNN